MCNIGFIALCTVRFWSFEFVSLGYSKVAKSGMKTTCPATACWEQLGTSQVTPNGRETKGIRPSGHMPFISSTHACDTRIHLQFFRLGSILEEFVSISHLVPLRDKSLVHPSNHRPIWNYERPRARALSSSTGAEQVPPTFFFSSTICLLEFSCIYPSNKIK